eukprot:Colp12_sorted_trinity150504_noHs@1624
MSLELSGSKMMGENSHFSNTEGSLHVPSPGPRTSGDDGIDPHSPPPSRVLHVRAVPDHATSADLTAALSAFGTVSYIMMMPRVRQALVEMESFKSAMAAVDYNKQNAVYVVGRPVYFNYSKSKEINRSKVTVSDDRDATRILLLTVLNPLYPINTEVIHSICSPYGVVQRIVVFRKNGVQVLVEFDTISSAARAKSSLNGADIYQGCCTLKVEYAKTESLHVRKNDDLTYDYTNPTPSTNPRPPRGGDRNPGNQGGANFRQGGYGGNNRFYMQGYP